MNKVSVYLPFQKISNARDLGGIVTKEGEIIAPGRLVRSADLARADQLDLKTLEYLNCQTIIDLRTRMERALEKDRIPAGSKELWIPVYHGRDLEKNEHGPIGLAAQAVVSMEEVFLNLYEDMIVNDDSLQAWHSFFEALANAPDDSMVLFHCTQGKDRTGMAAALIEHLFGVDEQTVLDDYLQTNLYLKADDQRDRLIASMLLSKTGKEHIDMDIDAAMLASKKYYDRAEQLVFKHWGSWRQYLKEAVGIDDELEKKLKEKYLYHPEKTIG